ncbi:hypothetical protein M5G25_19230 [Pseudomonas sp. TNT2022 ID357]|uniref:Phage tail protein n=1 Tax=Pseudomonas idahonensis TaxID=2942628 RepID=A0ABT5Q892_9PSED|nr:hypothetical protein [Pseudomonas idahonensis]MDD1150416.1 hypothetical protein [Pseudomonas idahonensis]
MARKEIKLGRPPQGAEGDTAREAFTKVNAMTHELYSEVERIESDVSAASDAAASAKALAEDVDKSIAGVHDKVEKSASAAAAAKNAAESVADQVQDFTSQYGEKIDALGTTGNYETLPVGKGGTGVNTIGALAAALQIVGVYGKGSAVGTVSQSSGAPTGALIERGGNVNGEYIKFADGTLVCFITATLISEATYPVGSIFCSADKYYSFPARFSSAPLVVPVGVTVSVATGWAALETSATTSSTGIIKWLSPVSGSRGYIGYFAIGRWFE